jgi:cytochrome c oxidase subunit III
MMPARSVRNVHDLPQNVFGAGALTWWGMMGMIATEGITLVLVAGSYLYIRAGHSEWPPGRIPAPALLVPVATLVIMLLSIWPAVRASRRAKAHDARGVLVALVGQSAICVLALVLRAFEFAATGVRWDTNAYGSVVWGVLVAHTFVAALDVLDTLGLALLFALREPEEKHFVDVTENSFFWYFVVAAWCPLFVLVFLSPRW